VLVYLRSLYTPCLCGWRLLVTCLLSIYFWWLELLDRCSDIRVICWSGVNRTAQLCSIV